MRRSACGLQPRVCRGLDRVAAGASEPRRCCALWLSARARARDGQVRWTDTQRPAGVDSKRESTTARSAWHLEHCDDLPGTTPCIQKKDATSDKASRQDSQRRASCSPEGRSSVIYTAQLAGRGAQTPPSALPRAPEQDRVEATPLPEGCDAPLGGSVDKFRR